jgi:hypothetical protein
MRRVIKAVLTNMELGALSPIEEEASVSEIGEAVHRMTLRSSYQFGRGIP